jgi:hypothetical protein
MDIAVFNSACFFVTVETRLSIFDEMLVQKLKAVERYHAFECMKIPSGILNNKLVVKDNVSIFEKLLVLYFHNLQECMVVLWL